MILVVGGTGTLGAPLVRALVDGGEPVRVLARGATPGPDIEAAAGDVRDPAMLAEACRGCTAVVSAVHGFTGGRGAGPAAIDRDANLALIRACVDAGVGHLVLVSVHGAAPGHAMSLHRMKYAAERALADSGLGWTAVRPTPFLETWMGLVGGPIAGRGRTMVFGRDNPINFVSARDVADVIVRTLRDGPRDRVVDVVGPEDLTLNQVAARLAGVGVRAGHVPRAALRLMSRLAGPVAPAFARQARAAVHMDTADMTAHGDGTVPTTLDDLIRERTADPRPWSPAG